MNSIKDTARIDFKLSISEKKVFERSANIGGFRSLTDFILQSAREKSVTIIEKEQVLKLNESDAKIFADALLNPPEPNAALKKAFARYNDLDI